VTCCAVECGDEGRLPTGAFAVPVSTIGGRFAGLLHIPLEINNMLDITLPLGMGDGKCCSIRRGAN
jgi:hypothetical protein